MARIKKAYKETEKLEDWQKEMSKSIEKFAEYYVFLWHELEANGLTNAQIKGAIELLLKEEKED